MFPRFCPLLSKFFSYSSYSTWVISFTIRFSTVHLHSDYAKLSLSLFLSLETFLLPSRHVFPPRCPLGQSQSAHQDWAHHLSRYALIHSSIFILCFTSQWIAAMHAAAQTEIRALLHKFPFPTSQALLIRLKNVFILQFWSRWWGR